MSPRTPAFLRAPRPSAAACVSLFIAAALLVSGCASMGGATSGADIPPDAVPTVVRQSNGDTITQYRVNGQVRAIKVEPSRGPTYYVYDRDGDGIVDKAGDNPPQTYFKLFGWN